MRFTVTSAACLLLALPAAAVFLGCGGRPPASAVTVGRCVSGGTPLSSVWSFVLAPRGHPSGTLALELVRDGHVRTLARSRFSDLGAHGTVSVGQFPRDLTLLSDIPGRGAQPRQQPVALPGHIWVKATDASERTLSVAGEGGEQVIWLQRWGARTTPQGASEALGRLAAVVAASRRDPQALIYCLTLRVDPG